MARAPSEKDFAWVRDNTRQFDCAVENLSDDFTQIAIQGPKGVNLLQKLTNADLSSVKFYWVTLGKVCGLPNTLIARTGYTGEDGFEIYVPSDEETSTRVWNEVLGAGREFGAEPECERVGRSVVADGEHRLGFVRRLRLLKRGYRGRREALIDGDGGW